MNSKFYIELALKKLGTSQKELAKELGVSPTQVTKWKKGDSMSLEMEERFRSLTGIGDLDPSVVATAGSVEQALKWDRLVQFLAQLAVESAETGYDTVPLIDDLGLLTVSVFECFNSLGIRIPEKLPPEIDFDFDDYSPESEEEYEAVLRENAYSSTIYAAFLGLNDLYGFYAAYISELETNEKITLMGTEAENIGHCLLQLAFAKLNLDPAFANEAKQFQYQTFRDYEHWINVLKSEAWQASVPVRIELMQLVRGDNDEIGNAAERESLGFSSDQIHPDVYMNELLVGMRVIHQVLPAILNKLGLDDFELDTDELEPR